MKELKAMMKAKQHNDNGTLHGFLATIAAILAVVFLICKAVPVLALDEGAVDIPGPINEHILADEYDANSKDATGEYALTKDDDSTLLLPGLGDIFCVDSFGVIRPRPFDDSVYEELLKQIAANDDTPSNGYYASDYYILTLEHRVDDLESLSINKTIMLSDLTEKAKTQERQITKLEQTAHDTTRNFVITIVVLGACFLIYNCYMQRRIYRLEAEIESWAYEDDEDDTAEDTNEADEAGGNLNE